MMPVRYQSQLRLMVSNCENLFIYLDRWDGRSLSNLNEKEWQALSSAKVANKPLSKVRRLAESFRHADPDILMLSEVGGEESLLNFNRHFLADQFQPFWLESNSDRGIDLAYLVHRRLSGSFSVYSHRHRALNFLYPHEVEANQYFAGLEPDRIKPSHKLSRDALELHWTIDGARQPRLVMLLVHLKSKLDRDRIDPGGRARREAELKTIVEIYNERRRDLPGVPFIVGGDFNGFASRINTETEFLMLHQNSDLIEAFDVLERPLEECASQVNFTRGQGRQLLKVDHLFVSPELADRIDGTGTFVHRFLDEGGKMLAAAQTLEQRNALPADHYPLVVTINDFWSF